MPSEYAPFKNAYLDEIRDNFMSPVFDELARGAKIRSVLDVGCGNGLFGADLKAKTGCRLAGVDASEYGLAQSAKAGYDETRPVKDLCTERLPFADGTFDFAMCKDVLEHLLDPLALLREIRRVLAPGGRLLTLVPNHFTLPARAKFLATNDVDTYGFFPTAHEWDFPHIRFYTRPGFLAMHAEAGFDEAEDLARHFFVRVPKLWRAPGYSAALGALHKSFPSSFATAHVATFVRRP